MKSELGACGLTKLLYTVKICQPRAHNHLGQNVKTQEKYYKGCEKCPSFHSWLKLILA